MAEERERLGGAASGERVLGVFELSQLLKEAVEGPTLGLWVEGEVGRLTRHTSGHAYFTLKDERRDALLDCVMYRSEAARSGRVLAEGARVQLLGKASIYAPRGRLQWIAERARLAGRGALLEALERLKARLVAEGLTDPARRRPLPETPRLVGVVTSATGAAFADIRKVARRRGRVHLLLAPTLVQGDSAPASIVAALDAIERVRELDVLIVGRGGGSQEDLMAWNDERVVRRVAACRVPVVSAVGHEVDITLTDLVADARAATPSEAAELVVPSHGERLEHLARAARALRRAVQMRLREEGGRLREARRRLGDPRFALAEHQQLLDELSQRLERARYRSLGARRTRLDSLLGRLRARHPRLVLLGARAELGPLGQRLESSGRQLGVTRRAKLAEMAHALSVLSPLAVLGRGYSLTTDGEGRVVRRASELSPGREVLVRLELGAFRAEVRQILEPVENREGLDQKEPRRGAGGGAPTRGSQS
jgi:exodeoxyribonuclease VII large subunit